MTIGPYKNCTQKPAARPVATQTPRPVPRIRVGKDSADEQSSERKLTQRHMVYEHRGRVQLWSD